MLIAVVGAIQAAAGKGEGIAYVAHLGGALFGWVYIRFIPTRGMQFAASERYFRLRNSYFRWKRRRAGRKFEVYMRDHGRKDFRAADHFDDHGNYRGSTDEPSSCGPKIVPSKPSDKDSGSGWLN